MNTPERPAPSLTLHAGQSSTSGEIPILLVSSLSATGQLSIVDSSFRSPWSIGASGQSLPQDAGVVYSFSCDSLPDGNSSRTCSTSTVSSSNLEGEVRNICQMEQKTNLCSSSQFVSASPYTDTHGDKKIFSDLSLVKPQSGPIPETNAMLRDSALKCERSDMLSDSSDLQAHFIYFHRNVLGATEYNEYSGQDVPISPASTFLHSPPLSAATGLTDDSIMHIFKRDLRYKSSPTAAALQSFSANVPQVLPRKSPTPACTNYNPRLSIHSIHTRGTGTLVTPEWLHGMRVELSIDQEGFRTIRPQLEISSFFSGKGANPAGELLDVAEFVMQTRQTWHFHYAPLDRAPTLRRLTVNGDMNDYISRQAALTIKNNGVYAVASTEDGGRVAWKFEYLVEDRVDPGSNKIMHGEKRFTPLRFVCNPTMLTTERGKKIRLLQFMRKSVIPKLQSVRISLGDGAETVSFPRKRNNKDGVSTNADIVNGRDGTGEIELGPNGQNTGPTAVQNIIPLSALNTMFPIQSSQAPSEGSPPRPARRRRIWTI